MRAGLLVCITLLTGAAPAAADQPLPPPPEFTRAERAGWPSMIGPTPARWSPTGTTVADTGFRPTVNGFSFFNYATEHSVPNIANAYAFNEPAEVTNLATAQVRTLFGDDVCRSRRGKCELTYAGRHWRDATNAVMSSGHCWGMALGAAELYSRAGARPRPSTADLRLTVPLQRRIARWQATQFEVNLDRYVTDPRSAVAALRSDLVAGSAPYVMLVESAQGLQHTLMPYAVLDRGGGRYDLAVYDSNYPGRERAIHVDVVANTFAYEAFAEPQVLIASADLGLVPVAKLREQFTCPFCPDAARVTVHLWNQPAKAPAVVAKLAVQGAAQQTTRGESTWEDTGQLRSSTWRVKPGTPFALQLRTTRPRATTVSASVTMGDLTWHLSGLRVGPGTPAEISVRPNRRRLVTSAAVDSVAAVDTQPGAEVRAQVVSTPARPVTVEVGNGRILIRSHTDRSSRMKAMAQTAQTDPHGIFRDATRRSLAVPARGQVSIDYANWSRQNPLGVRITAGSARPH